MIPYHYIFQICCLLTLVAVPFALTKKDMQHLAPSNLLLWKAAEWGNEMGWKTFHLGGGVGSLEDSLFKFKRAFYRGELCRYHIGKKIYDYTKYDELCKKSNNSNTGYFPEYRFRK